MWYQNISKLKTDTMSKLRGQLRFFVIVAVGALTVYVFYNYFGSSASVKTRTAKDSKVLKYHQLAGQVDPGIQHQKEDVHESRPLVHVHVDSQESRPFDVDSQENHPHQLNPDKLNHQGPDGNPGIDEMKRDNDMAHSNDDLQQRQPEDDSKRNGGRKKFSPFVTEADKEEFDLYTEKDPKFFNFFEKQLRLVHLDLKGAAPKLSYLEKVIPLFSEMGATGLLIEYEDMFPYDDHLSTLAAKNAYSKDDILKINEMAVKKGMSVIPLIPTFGHMEFVLKGKTYQSLREEEYIPQVISPTENSRIVIKAMIEQVKKLHPNSKYLHIGCDEVYRLGEGKSKKLLQDENMTPEDLFFSHVTAVAKMVKNLDMLPIMWDDMFRKLDQEVLKKSGIGNLVQPMVWQYVQQPQAKLPEDIWSKYGVVFGNVWVASSFKGATGSSQYITDVSYHLENHLNWVEIIKFYGSDLGRKSVNFVGVALTGWQRYDHFATLCELLPVAIPSLAVCLQTLRNGYFDQSLHEKITQNLLQCQDLLELRLLPKADNVSACEFPGSKIYYEVQELYELRKEKVEGYRVAHRLSGWMSSYNVKHNFSSPGQLAVFKKNVEPISEKLLDLRKRMEKSLLEVFDKYTTAEFLEVQIDSVLDKLDRELKLALSLALRKDWPRRPIIGDEQDDSKDTLKINNADQDQAGGRIDFGGNNGKQQNQQGGDGHPIKQDGVNEGIYRKNVNPSNQFVNKAIPSENAGQQGLQNLNQRKNANNYVRGGKVANQVVNQPEEGIQVGAQAIQIPGQDNHQVQLPRQAKQMPPLGQQLRGLSRNAQNNQVPFSNFNRGLINGQKRKEELAGLGLDPLKYDLNKRQPGNFEVKENLDKDEVLNNKRVGLENKDDEGQESNNGQARDEAKYHRANDRSGNSKENIDNGFRNEQ